jgi:hypothetical protein
MTAARMTASLDPIEMAKLDASCEKVLVAQAGRRGAAVVAHATAGRVIAAWTLDPAPVDPVAHLERAHVRGRQHLRRLLDRPSDAEVRSPMTAQLYDRLTRPADPMRAKRIDYMSVKSYTYTPRKPLRRVLAHVLDHLNQIDQWQLWRRDGVTPTPTDGWAPSTVTLPEDRLPLTTVDVEAWLWRIDQAVRLLIQRAATLSDDELDWQPPDGGWPLRRVLHHVARSELLYAASFDEALPDEPIARYQEADARFRKRLGSAEGAAVDPSIVFPDPYGTFFTPAEVIGEVLSLEDELLAQASSAS